MGSHQDAYQHPPGPGASLRARITGEIVQARSRPLRPAVLRALTCSVAAAVLATILWARPAPNPPWVLTAASAGAVVGCILTLRTPLTARFGMTPRPGSASPSATGNPNRSRVTDRALSCGTDLALQPAIQCDLTETLYRLVVAGRGVAWLPGLLTQPAVDEGLIVRVGGGRWDVDLEVRLYRRRSSQQGEQARAIWTRALQRADNA